MSMMMRSTATLFLMIWHLFCTCTDQRIKICDIFSIVADSASWGWKWRGENKTQIRVLCCDGSAIHLTKSYFV